MYERFSVLTYNAHCFYYRPLFLTLTEDDRKIIGRNSKAILNYGRQIYLENRGYKCKVFEYVTEETSPENVCILAKRVTQDSTSWFLLCAAWSYKDKGMYVPLFNEKFVILINFIFIVQLYSNYNVCIHEKNFTSHN
jgi:hypothetical protein